MTEKALRGEYQTTAPLGYKNENGSLAIVEEAKYIKYIFSEFINAHSTYKISKALNSIGFRTRKGVKIKKNSIEYILRNPVYKGYSRWTKSGRMKNNYNNPDTIIAKSSFEPIIDEKTFDLVQEIINKTKLLTPKNA